MKKTKEKILDTALELFNSRGLSQVKLRTIANEMGISQGNLSYHFKRREEVIEALYFRLVEEINEKMMVKELPSSMLAALFSMSEAVMRSLYTYRFIMLDFTQVMRENEKINTHFKELKAQREMQFMGFFELLVQAGLMRPEKLPNEYQNLYKRVQILGDFWLADAEIEQQVITKESIHRYVEIINQTIYPYLTEQGKEEYDRISRRYRD